MRSRRRGGAEGGAPSSAAAVPRGARDGEDWFADSGDGDDWFEGAPERTGGGGGGGRGRGQRFRDDGGYGGDSRGGSQRRGGRGGGRGGGGRQQDRRGGYGRGGDRGGRGDGRQRGRRSGPPGEEGGERKINLRSLEAAGFVHLFGIAPVLNALSAGRRDLVLSSEKSEAGVTPLQNLLTDQLNEEDQGQEMDVKPEAQFSPWLFVQETSQRGAGRGSARSASKARAAREIEELAEERGVRIARVDKGVLNSLCGSRPHQGFVLRCGALDLEPLPQLPHPDEDASAPSLWLVLDEVVDPQNFGALLRSAHFLGRGGAKVGVLVCSKNSAPPSPVVSAASSGALELCDVYSTSNLPRTLLAASEAGFRVLGAAAEAPSQLTDAADGQPVECLDLSDVASAAEDGRPTALVLGSEGDGLRNLVARACTGFVRIPGGVGGGENSGTTAGVDSLNVSVTGGIMLWHLSN